ncbi:class I SAM-dependent methyltransferase [Blastococcus sp. TBT05-19]|uniref:class I SAM-dependent methyltransferase n=1 Tax=Blastococcus sp. TBT05-19 TaxID=2250581 RepID=UPI000DEA6B9A|nr:class I SAM-dependent methyltransferase [Blastococcus sp. TBT05-19]RBY91759.1 class I SAM-dependent methyltransferase [Blastococcus sp. TBT05-19]
MIERAKVALRGKLVNAVREAVGETRPEETRALVRSVLEATEERRRQAELHSAELSRQLEDLRAEVLRLQAAVAGYEHRHRRDIGFAGDALALQETTRFVLREMPGLPRYPDPHDTLRHGLDLVGDMPGLALEFGVGEGTSLRIIAERCAGRKVVGFDVFSGLPETWRSDFPAGAFAQESLPEVPGAELVVGLFEDTLPGFVAANEGPIAFLHLDADLYSSTVTVLDALGHWLRPGSVVVFDEYFNYPGWQDHEHKAWTEFVARTGVTYRWEAYSLDHEQLVATILTTPWDS